MKRKKRYQELAEWTGGTRRKRIQKEKNWDSDTLIELRDSLDANIAKNGVWRKGADFWLRAEEFLINGICRQNGFWKENRRFPSIDVDGVSCFFVCQRRKRKYFYKSLQVWRNPYLEEQAERFCVVMNGRQLERNCFIKRFPQCYKHHKENCPHGNGWLSTNEDVDMWIFFYG